MSAKIKNNILETIGHTPMIRLNSVAQGIQATVLAKVETFNPGHSIKDRMAVKMIDDAEASGKLSPGGTIIECTSGNTGMGLALVACVRGYKCIFTTSDKQSKEKIDMLKAMGAEVIVCPTNVEPTDPRSYYSVAEKLSKEINNSFWCNQYDNLSNGQAHYESTGPEIWDQTDGKITHLVVGVGTGGTISGTARFLKEKNPAIRIWGIDTYGSVFKKYHETGIFDEKEIYPYITEGIGEDILPKNVDFSLIDLFEKVSDKDAALAARRLAREEGILLGYSAGSALAGLHQLKNQLKPEDTVVLIFHDHGSRYVGKIYNDDWMRQRGFLESELKVRDLVAAKKDKSFYSVSPDSRLRDVLTMIKDHDISQLPVMKDEEVIGTISENSILQYILENPLKNADKAVSEIMSEPMPRVSMDLPLGMLNKCFTEKIPGVITRDQSNQYHVLTKYDIIRAL
ncbi:MAG: pyridoxal-phosphate dependent enzyme [Saprospiraceae bacterium]|nr:pyridoxal-phosphate dependent enzyme [Saprospiraceae bacterium]HMW39477.1 pyridoxal-phosphate dependent enzyme [Saprospiraceae bacterium]HMX88085.1 pyridoxal-phosphate dependent enzyme [Saprospiraceae bacterium]HMZ38948.1 pyridoxal-phosphate dependent enzyme [Saprospiraceae bacterium]HNB30986.1 pyridoxal-phosphate dependent enzyme [Saprospiraceae bacterium]